MSGIIAVLISTIIWGAAPPIFKYSLEGVPPFTLAFIRFFAAGLIYLPFAIWKKQALDFSQLSYIFLGAFFGIVVNVAAFFVGLTLAPSINVHIISSIGPLVLYFLSIYILKEKPHAQIFKGMLIAVAGVLVIFTAPWIKSGFDGPAGQANDIIIGNFLFIIAMLGGVFYAVINKKIIRSVNPVFLTTIQFFVGSFAFIPIMLRELQTWSFSALTNVGWVGIIYGVFFSSSIAYFLLNYSLKRISTQQIGMIEYLKPVIAILVAVPLLSEYPDIYFVIGSILVFIGLYISERHPHYQKIKAQTHHGRIH